MGLLVTKQKWSPREGTSFKPCRSRAISLPFVVEKGGCSWGHWRWGPIAPSGGRIKAASEYLTDTLSLHFGYPFVVYNAAPAQMYTTPVQILQQLWRLPPGVKSYIFYVVDGQCLCTAGCHTCHMCLRTSSESCYLLKCRRWAETVRYDHDC